MIIVLGSPEFTRAQGPTIMGDWPEMVRCFWGAKGAAGLCEGTLPPHVVVTSEIGLYLMQRVRCLGDTANICMTEEGLVYSPNGYSDPRNIMPVDSLNEAIRHALKLEGETTLA